MLSETAEYRRRGRRSRWWPLVLQVLLFLGVFATASTQPWAALAQAPAASAAIGDVRISEDDLREWLTELASDRMQGRQAFTEGYGLAAQYVAGHLAAWGVQPLGPNGSYLQPVAIRGYRVTRNSSVTIEVNGESTTFPHGEHVTFPAGAGGRQTLVFDGVELAGYGRPADYEGRDVTGRLVVTVPNLAPPEGGRGRAGGGGGRGNTAAAIAAGAAAAVGFTPPPPAPSAAEQALTDAQAALTQATAALAQAQQAVQGRGGRGGRGGGRGAAPQPDLTSAQQVDAIVTPQFTADDAFFDALFRASDITFADIRARAERGDPIEPRSIPARVTVTIDNSYEPVTQQITHNVVGLVEGTDPALKDTYVLLGAHLDHVGYSPTGAGQDRAFTACRRRSDAAQAAVVAAGRTVQRATTPPEDGPGGRGRGRGAAPPAPERPFDERDGISNGADDNASGSAALLALAQAFATGPRPARSLVFVWHTGEESGLYGSRYNADFPVVPLDRVQAHINLDMVGRDDCDNAEGDYTNTVFVVGADRISTDLHNAIVEANRALPVPLTLDYELNDAGDPENVYTRSDHFSYAAKGIPVAFFTTGLHPDYHRVSDTVDRIVFPKLARIAQLVYRTAFALADRERELVRDNRGPRTGFGSPAELLDR